MRRAIASFAAIFLVSSAAPSTASAQDNSAVVEALFSEGKKLMAAGNIAEACPKFLASYNLEHRVGTLLNLADCYEKNRQFASAWARYVEAKTLASRNNQIDRADYAAQHAAAVESRRSTLSIVVDHAPPGLVVKRDGVVVDAAVYGVLVPIDGGRHTIESSAPGKKSKTETVTVGPEGDKKTYGVPTLTDAPKVAPDAPPPGLEPRGMSTRAVAGLVIAGGGILAAGVGAFFGATALSKDSDASPYCNVGGVKDNCYGQGVSLRSDAVSDATLSSVLVGVGAAAVVGGVVLWLTAPSANATATVGFDGRVLRVRGTF
jgi:hypothetical protein